VRLLPKSLVGRNALFLTLILILNYLLWFSVVRPAVYNRYVSPYQIYHPRGIFRLYLELEWAAFALLICTLGVYIVFFWMRRQLQTLVSAAQTLGEGRTPAPIAETGPEEIRQLSRGFNQLAENLEKLDADRRLMLVGISHDLSTPLTRLRLAIELLQMKGDLSQTTGMIQDVEDMNAILLQFADYARSGKEEACGPGNLNQLVTEVCHRYIAAGKPIRTVLTPLPEFDFRPLALRRLVTNLVDNASRYGGRDIEVSTGYVEPNVLLTVQDRGPGIHAADPNSLIRPFARGSLPRCEQTGAGLGLSIVERIAGLHGGAVTLRNRTAGGLAVIVTLPAGAPT